MPNKVVTARDAAALIETREIDLAICRSTGCHPVPRHASFVQPDGALRGIARTLIGRTEAELVRAGFTRVALGATRSGVAFNRSLGFRALGPAEIALPCGRGFSLVMMDKVLAEGTPLTKRPECADGRLGTDAGRACNPIARDTLVP